MSARQVLSIVDALLADGAQGFVVTLAALIAASPPPAGVQIGSTTVISRRRPAAEMRPASMGAQLSINLRGAATDPIQPPYQKDGRVTLTARYETFEANEDNLENQVAYAAAALSLVIANNLRAYSDAHGGTVVEVENPMSFSFGDFEGPVASGFIATLVITERSSE